MAFLLQNPNQFAQSPILGAVDLIPTPNVVTAQILPTSALTSLQVGDAVKLVTGTSGAILVDKQTGPTDATVFGVIPYNEKKNIYVKGDLVEVALQGSVVYMRSSAAVVRGTKVAITASTTTTDPLVTTDVTAAHFVTGIALDEASAANQLIRVRIEPSTNP